MSHNKPLLCYFVPYGNIRTNLFILAWQYQYCICPCIFLCFDYPLSENTYIIWKSCKPKYCTRFHSIFNVQLWFCCRTIYNLVAGRIWHLLHGQVQFFIEWFVENVRMAVNVLDVCIVIEGDTPAGSKNWKAWAVITSVWLGWENARLKNTEKLILLR